MNNYIKNPNLPDSRVKCVIIDKKVSDETKRKLKKKGIEVICSTVVNDLYCAVNTHPDMQIHHLGDNNFVCEPTTSYYYKNLLPDANIIEGKTILRSNYPYDISYNIARVGNFVFHNFKYTDRYIYEYYYQKDFELIDVKQGYSKCSIVPVNNNSIITSDLKIANIADNYNIDVLYVNPEEIKLNGVSNGLIGGICGKIDKDILAVNGDLDKMNICDQINLFLQKYHIKILKLNDEIPYDIGSILPIF